MNGAESATTSGDAAATEKSATASSLKSNPRRKSWLTGALRVVVVAAAGVGLTWGIMAWQERPVKEAIATLKAGKAKRALGLVDLYLASHPQDDRALAIRGRALVELGRGEEASAIFERVGAGPAEDVHAWAKSYLLQQNWSRAEPVLEHLLRSQPSDPDALHEISTCRIRLGKLDEALQSAQQLAAIPGQEARGWIIQAAIYNDLANHDKSADAYRRVLKYSPDATDLQIPPEEVFLQFGSVLLNSGHPAEAAEMLQRCVAVRPLATAYVGIGNANSQLGKLDAAIDAWKRAVALDPSEWAPREALANAAMQKRDFAAARKWLEPLEKSGDVRSSTAYLLQRVLTLTGDEHAGRAWSEKAEALRKREQFHDSLELLLLRTPSSFWAKIIRAHRFAAVQNWRQAEDLLKEAGASASKEPFVQKMVAAVRDRAELPPLEELPTKLF